MRVSSNELFSTLKNHPKDWKKKIGVFMANESVSGHLKMMCQAMTSKCFNTHCNTLSSKLNPDAPPFIPNPTESNP